MAPETSRSGASADSYIGSLISLTSKSEIRYEGILYSINTEESSIGLRNVRSFGTEGRKKDGPQIPPSDKIYEYILFRGTDIKDLQVKSSPPAQPTTINNDPAIIQTHYPHPVSTSTSLPTAGSGGTTTDVTSHSAQLGLPRPTFQGGLPPYQPSGGLGTWGSSPAPPTANGSGLGMPPMYWQGYYAPSSGLPQLQQTTLLRPPPGLPLPHSMQHPFQYPGINPSLPSGAQSFPELPPLFPQANSNPALTSSPLPLTLDLSSTSSLSMETSSTLLQNKAPVTTLAASTFGISLPLASPSISNFEKVIPSTTSAFSSNPIIGHGSTLPYLSISQAEPPTTVSSSSSQVEKAVALVTPDKLLPLVTSVLPSSQPLQTGKIDADVKVGDEKAKLLLSEPTLGAPAETKEPILPLPKSNLHKANGATSHNFYNRGRGRGQGNVPRHVTKFTEDFDFTAMNEKFNKDEVWGNLGKNKTHLKDNDGVFQEDETYDTLEEDDDTLNKITSKPVYVKDDFFDTLSCTTLDRGTRGGRTRFSEQLKIDTETFGDFTRLRPGRSGGRGFRGGGRRGSYYGGGYGYNRGRGYGYSHRAS
ncbi:protein decapping 5-like isoform X1 [Zingiber officinale]|uniref:protein decapping 5-like isoform X1 n=1 Tax=Zingiber officinale TaxID=94328 RepID=UPI001C4C713F|nr:protein decapping 5-like isoform X1 [Zingiber officinale]